MREVNETSSWGCLAGAMREYGGCGRMRAAGEGSMFTGLGRWLIGVVFCMVVSR